MLKKVYLYSGCNLFELDGWEIISDNSTAHLENESVDELYACNVVDSIDHRDIILLLSEWNRILKRDGTIRIMVTENDDIFTLKIMSELLSFCGFVNVSRYDRRFQWLPQFRKSVISTLHVIATKKQEPTEEILLSPRLRSLLER